MRYSFLLPWYTLFVLLVVGKTTILAESPSVLHGIGILGDSDSDEYQFVVEEGKVTRSSARNWLELLAEHRHLNFGEFSRESRGAPREEGYAFNWGMSGDTILGTRPDRDLPAQLAGLKQQVRAGDVTLVFVELGDNDLGFGDGNRVGKFHEIAKGALHGAELTRYLQSLVGELGSALDQLAAAGHVEFVLSTIQDPSGWKNVNAIDTPQGDRVKEAVERFNRMLLKLASDRHIPVVDVYAIARMAKEPGPVVGGVTLHPWRYATDFQGDPRTFYSDGVHYGTLVNGIYANAFIAAINRAYDAKIEPLSDQELLAAAAKAAHYDLSFAPAPPTYFDVQRLVLWNPPSSRAE